MKKFIYILSLLLLSVKLLAEPKMTVVSWSPRIFLIENFLTPEECDQMIAFTKPHLKCLRPCPSLEKCKPYAQVFFDSIGPFPLIRDIEQRLAKLSLIPVQNIEGIKVMYYKTGDTRVLHGDYFDPSTQFGREAIAEAGQRLATFVMYLNDPPAGGTTDFPYAKITLKPKKGNAILFFDCLNDGTPDLMSRHVGSPVVEGEKWIANVHLRAKSFRNTGATQNPQ